MVLAHSRWKTTVIKECIINITETDMELTSLRNEAMKLHPAGRAQLAKELLNSLEKLSKPEIEQLWVEEAIRRNAEIENG